MSSRFDEWTFVERWLFDKVASAGSACCDTPLALIERCAIPRIEVFGNDRTR